MHQKLLIAAVAEYRKVALVEHAGNKRAVWRGIEYTTDGRTWLYVRPGQEAALQRALGEPVEAEPAEPGLITTYGLPTERAAKELLDSLPAPSAIFMSVRELYRMYGKTPARTPAGRWDAHQGVFVD